MALSKIVWVAIIAVALFLALTVAPTWFMAFPILFGLIALACNKKEEKTLPVSTLAGDTMPDASAPAAAVVAHEVHRREREEPTLQVLVAAGEASAPAQREEPTLGVCASAGDASAPAAAVVTPEVHGEKREELTLGASASAGDASAPAAAVVTPEVHGEKREELTLGASASAGDASAPAAAVVTPEVQEELTLGASASAGDASAPAAAVVTPEVQEELTLGASASAGDASAPAAAVVTPEVHGEKSEEPITPEVHREKREEPILRVHASAPAPAPELPIISSSSSEMDFEVFLNFHGPDTRHGPDTCQGFADVLYNSLVGAGIKVFRGEESLKTGEDITTELKKVIRQSSVMIPIFSRTYASCKWCLRELELMLESRDLYGQTIIPIFYDVSPSDVRYQAEEFGKFFNLHEMDRVDSKTIERWRKVLRRTGGLSGLARENINGGSDANLVAEVVERVVHELRYHDQVITDKIVGIDLHVQEMMRKLGYASSETQASGVQGEDLCVVGIWGMPGVGKTTLAKVIYNKLHRSFDACSFIEDISSVGVSFSQRKLIADLRKQTRAPLESSSEGIKEIASLFLNKKLLIILDNVNEEDQIVKLIVDFTWLAPGSRIIVTTRKKRLLSSAFGVRAGFRGIVEEHEVRPLSDDEALQLFWHTFQGNAYEDNPEYYDLSKEIVRAAGGVPRTIKRHALYLRNHMNIDRWRTTLELLRKSPSDRQPALQISYADESEL